MLKFCGVDSVNGERIRIGNQEKTRAEIIINIPSFIDFELLCTFLFNIRNNKTKTKTNEKEKLEFCCKDDVVRLLPFLERTFTSDTVIILYI